MAVLSATEKPMSRSGSGSGTELSDKRVFLVKCDTPFESAYSIGTSAVFCAAVSGGGSWFLTPHPQCPYAMARSLDYGQPDAKTVFEVTVNYSSNPVTQAEKEKGVLDPRARKAKTRWDKRKESVPMIRDLDGKPVVNAAREFFDPGPQKQETIWIYRVEKNVDDRPTWLADYEDSVNNATLTIPGYTIQRGCGKLIIDDLGDEAEENGFSFYVFKYSIELRLNPNSTQCFDGTSPATAKAPRGWSLIALNQGLKELDGATLKNMTDDQGETLTAPYPLTTAGAKITGANALARLNAINYLVWDQFPEKDFSVLPGLS